MSTKNIARTAIEGGRVKSCRDEEHKYTQKERQEVRILLHKACLDPDLVDEEVAELRRSTYKEFADKLTPIRRWLAAQVGRPWNVVHAEIRRRFDDRTTAGRHILYDHLLRYVNYKKEAPPGYWRDIYEDKPWNDPTRQVIGREYRELPRFDFEINAAGILVKRQWD